MSKKREREELDDERKDDEEADYDALQIKKTRKFVSSEHIFDKKVQLKKLSAFVCRLTRTVAHIRDYAYSPSIYNAKRSRYLYTILQRYGVAVVRGDCKDVATVTSFLPKNIPTVLHDPKPPVPSSFFFYNDYKDDEGKYFHIVCTDEEETRLQVIPGSHTKQFRHMFFRLTQGYDLKRHAMVEIAQDSKLDQMTSVFNFVDDLDRRTLITIPPHSLVIFHPRVMRCLTNKYLHW